jgi:hypothetical protein
MNCVLFLLINLQRNFFTLRLTFHYNGITTVINITPHFWKSKSKKSVEIFIIIMDSLPNTIILAE